MRTKLDRNFIDSLYLLFNEYKGFVGAKGVHRSVGVDWATKKIIHSNNLLFNEVVPTSLFQNIGWDTYMGFGLYSGIIGLIDNYDDDELSKLSYQLKLILSDISSYTRIGHLISFNLIVKKTEDFSFARIDSIGNIFIFPEDTEELLEYLDDIAYVY